MSIQWKPLIQMTTIFKILAHQNHNNTFQDLITKIARDRRVTRNRDT